MLSRSPEGRGNCGLSLSPRGERELHVLSRSPEGRGNFMCCPAPRRERDQKPLKAPSAAMAVSAFS